MIFEEYLLNKAQFHLDDIPQPLVIEIYNESLSNLPPCFFRGIYKMDSLKILFADCKEVNSTLAISNNKFNPIFTMNTISVPTIDINTNKLLDFIYNKCEQYYKSKGKEVEVIKTRSNEYSLTFNVTKLKNEVIKSNLITDSFEELTVKISCIIRNNKTIFEISMNGNYGSSLFRPINDFEDGHAKDFQLYVDDFANNKLLQWLK